MTQTHPTASRGILWVAGVAALLSLPAQAQQATPTPHPHPGPQHANGRQRRRGHPLHGGVQGVE